MTRPDLKVVQGISINPETGEVQDDRDILIAQLESEKRSQSLLIGKLKKQLAEMYLVEPEAEKIRDVLEYCRDRIGKPRQHIVPDGDRWKAVRARMRDKLEDRPPWTPAELKLAADGALLDPFISGKTPRSRDGRFLDAAFIYKTPERVEQLVALAIGFKGDAGIELRGLLDVADRLRIVHWRTMLHVCTCGHVRIEHARPDPSIEGRELCFECECGDFDIDPLEPLNFK